MKKYKNNYPMYMNISPKGNNLNGYEPYNAMPTPTPTPSTNPMYVPKGIQLPENEEEDNVEADLQYMKDMYPDTCKKIQVYVDEACDKMEYEGSMMYDKYPDKASIDKVTDHICDCIQRDGIMPMITQEVETEAVGTEAVGTDTVESEEVTMQVRRNDIWARDLVLLLLLNELFGRRRNRYGYRGGYREPYGYYEPTYNYSPYQSQSYQQYPYYNRNYY